jgi:hypothetical protein
VSPRLSGAHTSLIKLQRRAVLHDEATYGPKPDEFIPERWLNKDGEINTAMREPSAAFGFGRRSCPVSVDFLGFYSANVYN